MLSGNGLISKIKNANGESFRATHKGNIDSAKAATDESNNLINELADNIKNERSNKESYVKIDARTLNVFIKDFKADADETRILFHAANIDKHFMNKKDDESVKAVANFNALAASTRRAIAVYNKLYAILLNVYVHAPNITEKNGEFVEKETTDE